MGKIESLQHGNSERTGPADSRSASRRRVAGRHPVPHLRSAESGSRLGRRRCREGSQPRRSDETARQVAYSVTWAESEIASLAEQAEYIAKDSPSYAATLVSKT